MIQCGCQSGVMTPANCDWNALVWNTCEKTTQRFVPALNQVRSGLLSSPSSRGQRQNRGLHTWIDSFP